MNRGSDCSKGLPDDIKATYVAERKALTAIKEQKKALKVAVIEQKKA